MGLLFNQVNIALSLSLKKKNPQKKKTLCSINSRLTMFYLSFSLLPRKTVTHMVGTFPKNVLHRVILQVCFAGEHTAAIFGKGLSPFLSLCSGRCRRKTQICTRTCCRLWFASRAWRPSCREPETSSATSRTNTRGDS